MSTWMKSRYMPIVVLAVLVLPMIYAYENRYLSPRMLGMGLLIIIVGFFTLLLKRYRSFVDGGSTPVYQRNPRVAKTHRNLKVIAAVLVLALLLGLWSTRGAPTIPRLVGVAANILITSFVVYLIVKTRRRF